MRKREYDQVVIPQSPSKFAHYKTENRLREFDDDEMMDTNSQTGYSVDSRGQPKMKAMSLYKSNLDSQMPRMSQGENAGMPIVGCMPGCTKNCNPHNFDYDYTKNYKDALNKRPGEFAEYNWMAANYYLLQEENKTGNVVCDGELQTPINLDTNMPIQKDFKDFNFDFQYNVIDPKEQVKFNQVGQ